jgi:hypothetical protein
MPVTINIYNNNGRYRKINHHLITNRNAYLNTNRESSCDTPFRMPLNQYRNTTTNCNECLPNTKVLKDNHSIYCCYDPYIKNILNKNGKISNSFIFSKHHLLYKQNKLYHQNVFANFLSNTSLSDSSYNYQVSPLDVSNNKVLYCRKATYKKKNRNHNCNGAVSARARLNRLKYNSVDARIINNYGYKCSNRSKNCYDDNLPKFKVDINTSKRTYKLKYHDKKGRKFSCNPTYKKKEEEDINIIYKYPSFQYDSTPPPVNGLKTLYYFNDHYNFNTLFEYEPLEFNTNYDNKNKEALVGPEPTLNTTTSLPKTQYQTIITKHSVTYVSRTNDVTIITNINRTTGNIKTNSYVTGSEEEILKDLDDYDPSGNDEFKKLISFGALLNSITEQSNIQYNSDGTITTHDYSNIRENVVVRMNIVYSSTNYTSSSAEHALFNIIHITNAKPAVVTIDRNHNFTDGEEVLLQNIQGMTLLSGINYIVDNKKDTTFELKDSDTRYMNNFINTTSGTGSSNNGY